ncbi:MAG TPA: hypothetical protein PK264_02970 [Hyphomicrobiaceae bacterium]|nr:hypothetical protein [Hyphomicrobiaceae bacterium]
MGSTSVLHVSSGLFLTGVGGWRKDENHRELIGAWDNREPDSTFWHLDGGISKNDLGIGRTVFDGEYAPHTDGMRHRFSDVVSSDVMFWGLGMVQHIDAAASELFIADKHHDATFTRNAGTLAAPVFESVAANDFSAVVLGTRIKF